MNNCLRWLRQINLAKLLLSDQFTSFPSLITISTLLITVIRDVERLLLSLYLDSTRRLIIIINFNHSTSTLFLVQLDRVSGTRAKGEGLKKLVTPRKLLRVRGQPRSQAVADQMKICLHCTSSVGGVMMWQVQVANENGK